MAKVSPLQGSFNAGEFSPLLFGRVDAERYKAGLSTCLNYIPTIQGGLTRRPGSYFVSEVKTSSKSTRLVPFEFSSTQAYILEFGDLYIRFYKDNALITLPTVAITGATAANPVVVTATAHGYSNGDRVVITNVIGMTEINNREYIVANVAANTFELKTTLNVNVNGTGYTAYASGGTVAEVYEIVSGFEEADLFDIKYTQSADVIYLVHPAYAPVKLSRTGDTSWTLTTIDFLDGPYLTEDDSGTTLTPSAATGTGVTLTASTAIFASTDVGRLIRMKQGSVWGYCKITGFTSTTVVTVTIVNTLTSTAAKTVWRFGVWSDTTGYPQCVVFHEDRLFFGGSNSYPQRLDGSKSGDYENFPPTETDGTVTDANAVSFNLNSNDVNVIRWMTSDEKGLLCGTTSGEWVIRPSSTSEAISPTNVNARQTTNYGSAPIQALQVGKGTLFVQNSQKKVREMTFFFDVDGFRASDLTILSEHITQTGIIQMAYQKEPQSLVWCVREDGVMACMTYERDIDALKVGWHRHILGGYGTAALGDAIVESVASIPSPDGARRELWLVVKRYINGATHRYVEYLTKLFEAEDEQRDAFFVDCGLSYDEPKTITGATAANPVVITSTSHGFSNGDTVLISSVAGMTELNGESFTAANVAANTFELSGINGTTYGAYVSGGEVRKYVMAVSGLGHLEGETVSILANGAVQPDAVVTNGAISLVTKATTVQIGYSYNSDAELLRLEAGSSDGTSLGKTRRMHRVGMMLHRSLGLKIGMSFDSLDTVVFRTSADPLTRAPALFTGIISQNLAANYDFENQFCWRQDQPLPSTILAVMPQMVTEDRG